MGGGGADGRRPDSCRRCAGTLLSPTSSKLTRASTEGRGGAGLAGWMRGQHSDQWGVSSGRWDGGVAGQRDAAASLLHCARPCDHMTCKHMRSRKHSLQSHHSKEQRRVGPSDGQTNGNPKRTAASHASAQPKSDHVQQTTTTPPPQQQGRKRTGIQQHQLSKVQRCGIDSDE